MTNARIYAAAAGLFGFALGFVVGIRQSERWLAEHPVEYLQKSRYYRDPDTDVILVRGECHD